MRKVIENWITQAEIDLDSAKYNYSGKRFDVAAYLCQQSVEKALKALYLMRNNELWRTHDLVKLANLVHAPRKIVKACNGLNPIYVEDRYPDFSDTIPAYKFKGKDIREFLEKARTVLKWTKSQIN
jgi:HEPN domain-containing protein